MLARISNDENLHMIFYRDISAAGLAIAPNMAMASLYRILKNFKMPGYTVPELSRVLAVA
jgi:acyl-[acyl-carrier-protein] desaturase